MCAQAVHLFAAPTNMQVGSAACLLSPWSIKLSQIYALSVICSHALQQRRTNSSTIAQKGGAIWQQCQIPQLHTTIRISLLAVCVGSSQV